MLKGCETESIIISAVQMQNLVYSLEILTLFLWPLLFSSSPLLSVGNSPFHVRVCLIIEYVSLRE